MSTTPSAAAENAQYNWKQRLALWLITNLGYLLISLLGRTWRYEKSSEPGGLEDEMLPPHFTVGPFWHRCVIAGMPLFRGRGVAVMTSRSYDGEYIARIIERFGFVAVRGSSTRGGSAALLGMARVLRHGHMAAFAIDGPRGPRFVAKPGPVALARMSGAPIVCFYLAVERAWVLRSWDALMIPKPFARIHLRYATAIAVPRDADEAAQEACYQQMQAALERVRRDAVAALGPGAS